MRLLILIPSFLIWASLLSTSSEDFFLITSILTTVLIGTFLLKNWNGKYMDRKEYKGIIKNRFFDAFFVGMTIFFLEPKFDYLLALPIMLTLILFLLMPIIESTSKSEDG